MAQNEVITQDILNQSPNLVQMGAMVGDEIDAENFLVRKVSTKPTPQNEVITLELLRDSPNLRQMGALPGDEIDPENFLVRKFSTKEDAGKKDVSSEDRSFLDNFLYGIDEAGRLLANTADILERNFPLGRITTEFEYLSPEEAYGREFGKTSIDERKDLILRSKERALVQAYGAQEATGVAATLGEVVGTLADPTTLLPVGRGIGQAVTAGFSLGAGYSAVEDYAKKGEIDPFKAAAMGAFGGATGGAFAGAGQLIGKATRNAANRRVGKVEREVNERIVNSGMSPQEAIDDVVKGTVERQFNRDLQILGRQPNFAVSKTSAEEAIQNSIVNDSAVSRLYSATLDKYLGTLSTRIGNISQPVLRMMRKFEHDVHIDTKKFMDQAAPFMKQLKSLKKEDKAILGRHLAAGKFDDAEKLMTLPGMKENFQKVKEVLNELYDESIDSGLGLEYTPNYFPRFVKDYNKMAKELRFKKKNHLLDKALNDWATAHNKTVSDLTLAEKEKIIGLALRGYGVKVDAGKPSFAEMRQLTAEQLKENDVYERFYASPEEALSMYIRNSVHNARRREFLGYPSETGELGLKNSIAKIVAREKEAGRLDPNDEETLKELLNARFIGGEKSTSSAVGIIRDLGYMGTIANPISALTQLGDIGVSMAKYGFRDTIAAMFGAKNLRMIDMGLDRAGQEFADVRKSAQILDKLLGVSGFKAVDRLGKETIMNAALRKNIKAVKTPAGEQAFRKKWGKFYGDDIDTLISHLKSGQVTSRVKEHAFNELSDVQPISSLEMPQAYLENPNGRILYSLKTFTLKQLDVARRDVVQQWKRGNKTQAIKNASALAGYMAASGVAVQTVKDLLLGREVRPDDLPENALWALTGVYGINRYVSDKYLSKGNVKEAAVNMLAPATPIIDALFQAPFELAEEDPNLKQYMRNIPVAGPMLYNWFGGGAEKYNKRLRDR